jgi:CBS domain-containing protein
MPAYVAETSEPLDEVLLEMAARQLSSTVVVDHSGKLVGIITLTDVCRLYAEALQGRYPTRSRPYQTGRR